MAAEQPGSDILVELFSAGRNGARRKGARIGRAFAEMAGQLPVTDMVARAEAKEASEHFTEELAESATEVIDFLGQGFEVVISRDVILAYQPELPDTQPGSQRFPIFIGHIND